jgi:hypothetical protein
MRCAEAEVRPRRGYDMELGAVISARGRRPHRARPLRRPKCAFQRYHPSAIAWNSDSGGQHETEVQADYEFQVAQPSYVHMEEEDYVYQNVVPDHNDPSKCYTKAG